MHKGLITVNVNEDFMMESLSKHSNVHTDIFNRRLKERNPIFHETITIKNIVNGDLNRNVTSQCKLVLYLILEKS